MMTPLEYTVEYHARRILGDKATRQYLSAVKMVAFSEWMLYEYSTFYDVERAVMASIEYIEQALKVGEKA